MAHPIEVRRVDVSVGHLWATIVHLDTLCFAGSAPPLTSRDGCWWMATRDGNPVGYAGIMQAASTPDGGYLARAGVMPAARGEGLQKRLIRLRLRYAKAQGWRTVVTDTCDNPASANSLIACGARMFNPDSPWGLPRSLYWRFTIR